MQQSLERFDECARPVVKIRIGEPQYFPSSQGHRVVSIDVALPRLSSGMELKPFCLDKHLRFWPGEIDEPEHQIVCNNLVRADWLWEPKASEHSQRLTLELSVRLRVKNAPVEQPRDATCPCNALTWYPTHHLVDLVNARDSPTESMLHRLFEDILPAHACE